jgi:hypothetical protein
MEKAFAQFYRLPKMLNRRAIIETLLDGCRRGLFVLRSTRADHSFKTFWYDAPDAANIKDLNLVVVLAEEAELTGIPCRLLAPGVLPELWSGDELRLQEVYNYFSGKMLVKGEFEGETKAVPRAGRGVVNEAVQAAVKERRLWLLSGRASLLAEDVPVDLLTEEATLQAPPAPLATKDVLPEHLQEAWKGGMETTARAIAEALSTKAGRVLPWLIVRDALHAAFNANFLERAGGQWPCDYAGAGMVRVYQRTEEAEKKVGADGKVEVHDPDAVYKAGVLAAEAVLSVAEIQNLEEEIGALMKAGVDLFGAEPKFSLRVEIRPKGEFGREKVEEFNGILGEVSRGLRME